MRELTVAGREQYDYVIIDTPPLLGVTDAPPSSEADSVLLVVRSGKTTREAIVRASDVLNQARAPVLGFLVNGVDFRAVDSYYYGCYSELTKGYDQDDGSRS